MPEVSPLNAIGAFASTAWFASWACTLATSSGDLPPIVPNLLRILSSSREGEVPVYGFSKILLTFIALCCHASEPRGAPQAVPDAGVYPAVPSNSGSPTAGVYASPSGPRVPSLPCKNCAKGVVPAPVGACYPCIAGAVQ